MSVLKEKFCSQLRVIRAQKGITQEYVAGLLDMSPNGYAKIERGETDVTLSKVEEIAKALEVDISELLQLNSVNNYITNTGKAQVVNNQGTMNYNIHDHLFKSLVLRVEQLERQLSRSQFEGEKA